MNPRTLSSRVASMAPWTRSWMRALGAQAQAHLSGKRGSRVQWGQEQQWRGAGHYRSFSWARYQELLQGGGAVSVATKAITSAAIVGSGDVACQTLFENRSLRRVKNANSGNQEGEIAIAEPAVGRAAAESAVGRAAGSCHPFDYARLGNMTLLGAVLVAPVLHLWYGFLGRKMPGTAIGPVMGRVVLDQALFAPTFIAVFFSSLAALEGKSLQQLEQQLRDSWVESVITNWKLWVPCQIINLGFVPGHLQVLVSNVVALVWNSYMSYITHRPAATPSRTV